MKIAICGDLSVKDSRPLFERCEVDTLFHDVATVFEESDRVIVNLECAITDKDTPIAKIGPNLCAPTSTAKALCKAGVTDCVLSNNHIFDFGSNGIKDTLAYLSECGINHTGFGNDEADARRNLIINEGGVKIAVIAVCEHEYSYALKNRMGARAFDPYDTNDDIAEASRECDYVIVIYHGGKEDCAYPSPRLLKACRSMIKHGADIVLCQHSHIIGCYEKYMNGHILYGQGNFHFVCKEYESERDNGQSWNTGLIAHVNIDNGLEFSLIPTVVDGLGIRLAQGDEKEAILSGLYERSKSLDSDEWYDRWREFALSQKRYKIFDKKMHEEIAHFFDCEAHTDVCKEVYKTLNHKNEIE